MSDNKVNEQDPDPDPASACPVCCDVYTRDKRKPIPCAGCSYAACCVCVKTYLLASQADPACMNCGMYWSRAVLDAHLTTAWRNGALRRHREHVLLDRERSLLPATQSLVEREVRRRLLTQRRREALVRVKEARRNYNDAKNQYSRVCGEGGDREDEQSAQAGRRGFVAACPSPDCRGFLDTRYRCGTCQTSFCAACREPRGLEQEEKRHRCDPGTVETIALIAKECRVCPACGMAISRVSGCDHMWCTSCDTGFSYSTGQRISDRANTNPHMYERMRQLTSQSAPGDGCVVATRAGRPADCGAGGPEADVEWPPLSRIYELDEVQDHLQFCCSMHQCARHVESVVLPRVSTRRDATASSTLRIRYCLKDIDEKRFSALLQQLEKQRERLMELRQVLEVFVLMTFEFFHELLERFSGSERRSAQHCCSALCGAFASRVDELVNVPLQTLSTRYEVVMPRIETTVVPHLANPRFRSTTGLAQDLYLPHGHVPQRRAKRLGKTKEDSHV